jgi:hypothetical protein
MLSADCGLQTADLTTGDWRLATADFTIDDDD